MNADDLELIRLVGVSSWWVDRILGLELYERAAALQDMKAALAGFDGPEADRLSQQVRAVEACALQDILDGPPPTDDMILAELAAAIDAGADCPTLFVIAKQLPSKSPRRQQANTMLREVGCFSRTSTRSTA